MSASGFVHVEDVEVRAVTDRALLLSIDGDEHWVPKAAVADPDTFERGDGPVTVSLREWKARELGLDCD